MLSGSNYGADLYCVICRQASVPVLSIAYSGLLPTFQWLILWLGNRHERAGGGFGIILVFHCCAAVMLLLLVRPVSCWIRCLAWSAWEVGWLDFYSHVLLMLRVHTNHQSPKLIFNCYFLASAVAELREFPLLPCWRNNRAIAWYVFVTYNYLNS